MMMTRERVEKKQFLRPFFGVFLSTEVNKMHSKQGKACRGCACAGERTISPLFCLSLSLYSGCCNPWIVSTTTNELRGLLRLFPCALRVKSVHQTSGAFALTSAAPENLSVVSELTLNKLYRPDCTIIDYCTVRLYLRR